MVLITNWLWFLRLRLKSEQNYCSTVQAPGWTFLIATRATSSCGIFPLHKKLRCCLASDGSQYPPCYEHPSICPFANDLFISISDIIFRKWYGEFLLMRGRCDGMGRNKRRSIGTITWEMHSFFTSNNDKKDLNKDWFAAETKMERKTSQKKRIILLSHFFLFGCLQTLQIESIVFK